ncbi:RNA-directed DNA polymerase from mobile element jockey [Eumeta japonica]|uniref:RNA-directed DNA polymerase from mobile element jockey n=1 Tax=Eumeta variegata TaxID=151549 RepID=A0A4C1WBW9_EUMVA|nr:RNA-directed DNA polymerase from mobile element jockey [Eumeta japonica]
MRAGVPQGYTIFPVLYSTYINDIPRLKTGVQLALFADDTALFLRSNCLRNILPRLQRAIDELTQWLRLSRIETITFARRHWALSRSVILPCGCPQPVTIFAKYWLVCRDYLHYRYRVNEMRPGGCVRPLSFFYSNASANGVKERSLVTRSRSHARLKQNATMNDAFSCVQPAFIEL